MRLDRLAFAVADLDAAHRWAQSAGAGVVAWAEDDLIRAQQYEFAGGGRLEFVTPKAEADATSPIRRFLRRNEPRIHHVTILVDEFDVTVRRLRSSGFPVGRISDRWARWREGYLAPADTGDVLVQIAWHGGDDTSWARQVNHVPESPEEDGLVIVGASLRHSDLERGKEIWQLLGGRVTPTDWNGFTVDWPGGRLKLVVEPGDPGPVDMMVKQGPVARPLPDPRVFGSIVDVSAARTVPVLGEDG